MACWIPVTTVPTLRNEALPGFNVGSTLGFGRCVQGGVPKYAHHPGAFGMLDPPQNANVQFELMKVWTLTFYKFVKNFESRVFFISAPGRRALKRWCLKGRSSSHFRAEHRKPLQIMPRKFARHTSEGYTWTN